MVAADAGPMEIEWGKTAVSSVAEAVRRTWDSARDRSIHRWRRRLVDAVLSAINGLHLCETAIHKQFCSRDVAAVAGCEKHHGLGDLIGCAEPAERNTVGNHRQALLARF